MHGIATAILFNRGLVEGFPAFYSLGFFFLISEGMMVGEAGSGRHILTQK